MTNNDLNCNPVFPGTEVDSNDPRYPTLVRGFNQRFVGAPQYIHLCGDAEQVLQAVQKALNEDLRITVRGGGHCYEDFVSGNQGGVIIDLSPMHAVYKENDLFCIEGGCTLWNVYSQLYKEYGVTLPGGSCYSVGAGGHIIGGGYGFLSRKYGLTVDYLYEVEVVHVTKEREAKIITVNRNSENANEKDLFWAHLGGGGGNFGIVTKYWFKDPPVAPSEAYLTSLAWDWSDLDQDCFSQLVTNYGKFCQENSDVGSEYEDLFTILHLTHKDKGQITVTAQYVGDNPKLIENFIEAIKPREIEPVRQLYPVGYYHMVAQSGRARREKPISEDLFSKLRRLLKLQDTKENVLSENDIPSTRSMPWLEATQTLNTVGPNRRGKYKSAYMIEPFPKKQLEVIWHYLNVDDSSYGDLTDALLQVDSYGCQVNAISPADTAVPQRSSIMKLQYQVYWEEPDGDDGHLKWIRDFYNAMYPEGPYIEGIVDGCYVNYPDVDLENWQYLYYKDNYPRLQQAKASWDPLNIFHHQQSIELPE